MLSTRKIKRKIRSVNNIKKITRAMEMVSAAKLKKVQSRLVALRPFAAKLQEIMTNLYQTLPPELITHPLLKPRTTAEGKRVISVIVIASNKGLCGGYNTNLLKTANRFILEQNNTAVKIMAIGRKVIDYFRKTELEVTLTHPVLPSDITVQTARDIISPFVLDYEKEATQEIWVVYTEFVNAMVYKPRVKRLVPLKGSEEIHLAGNEKTEKQMVKHPAFPYGYLFEPEPRIILDQLVPRYLEISFYNILLDALASEHSARMLAMRNATENADEVIEHLTLTFNKARQASITKELLDIVGGAEAMK